MRFGRLGGTDLANGDEGANRVTRVLICENDPVMRSALADLIREFPSLQLVATAADPDEAGDVARRVAGIDAALLDVRMPHGGGPRAADLIREHHPDARIVAFSAHADQEVVVAMLLAGASDYLVKGVDDNALVDALQRIGNGRIGLSQAELEEVIFELVARLRARHAVVQEATA